MTTVVNPDSKKEVLSALLADEYGIEAPSKATKADLLALLSESGATIVTPEKTARSGDEAKIYTINLFKEKGNNSPVAGCINGKAFVLPRGKDIEVNEAIYLNLTQGAIRIEGEQQKDGGIITFNTPAYPLSLISVR